jgi:mannose-6-phosphate isomerase-like protein (cupin superfamily)
MYYKTGYQQQWVHPYYQQGCSQGYGMTGQHHYEPEFSHHQQTSPYGWQAQYGPTQIRDYGSKPYVVNIEEITKANNSFRAALWTGKHFQVTLMSINPGEDVGLEVHPDLDQFLRLEEGQGIVQMGERKDKIDFQRYVCDDDAIMVPAGTWHNLINTGYTPLKLYSIYAPPEHPFGTVHRTKAEAIAAEEHHNHSQP